MISQWILSLPIWAALLYFFSGVLLYPLGINLAKTKRNMGYLSLSFIALVTTYTTMVAITEDVSGVPLIEMVRVVIIAVLIWIGIIWVGPSKIGTNDRG